MLRRSFLTFLLVTTSLGASAGRPAISCVESVGITVSDLDRSIAFYTGVLNFEKVSEWEADGDAVERLTGVFGVKTRNARLRLGDEYLELVEYLAPSGQPWPADSHSNDRWFQHIAIIVSDMDRAYAHLRANHVRHASPGPQRLPDWNRNAAGIRAFYFRDPDGHPLEILQFPEGKGDPKWHRPTNQLFLGIDHTAIVVSDTEASLRFYRDSLGMHVAGESENWGLEQERLNNVFGARLCITSLRADSGPGIEFLEYLAPRDGRPYPADAKSNDLVHVETRVVGSAVGESAGILRNSGVAFVSSGVIDLPGVGGGQKSFLVRDPDGHAVRFVEK